MAIEYTQLQNLSRASTRPPKTATSYQAEETNVRNASPEAVAYGRPSAKPFCDWVDVLTLVSSFLCLAVCIMVIDPRFPYAWRLGYNNQLIILGFMLTIMNLCTRKVSTRLFVILETRWGSSTLQNLDAIVRQSIFVSQTSTYWIVVLLVLTALPLGLGVAYKSFIGGTASQLSTSTSIKQYGVFGQPYTHDQAFVYSKPAMTSFSDFLNTAGNDSINPNYTDKPQPFGFNQLLIDNGTSAVLDMPNSTILATIQQNLKLAESLTISAEVQATVAIYNTSTPSALNESKLWDTFYQLHTFTSYTGFRLGVSFSTNWADAFVWLGECPRTDNDYWYEHFSDVSDEDVTAFRSSNRTYLFNIYRQPCSAIWNVTSSYVTLLRANCTDVRTPNRFQNKEFNYMPVIGDIFDVYYTAMYPYISNPGSPWRMPSHTMLAATAYWTRWVSYGRAHAIATPSLNLTQDFVYSVPEERIISTRLTLAARPGLYATLIIQPALTLLFLVLTILLYSSPVDSGFGLISILASLEEDCLAYVRGAGLSGKLEKPLHLNVSVESSNRSDKDDRNGRIRSRISLSRRSTRMRVKQGLMYE